MLWCFLLLSRPVLAYFMPNQVIIVVYISLLYYDTLMLLVWSDLFLLAFGISCETWSFWVSTKNIMGSHFSLFSSHYFCHTPLLGLAVYGQFIQHACFSYISAIPYLILMKLVLPFTLYSNFQAKATIQTYLRRHLT